MGNDSRHRKYQLTINNPGEDWTHEIIRSALNELKLKYWCMSDEVGVKEQTPHTHIYFVAETSAIRFSTVKGLFPTAHIEAAQGTSQENRDYIHKEGKWADGEKAETSVPGTFEEWGELPVEPGQGFRSDIAQLYTMIAYGMSNAEIMSADPDLAIHISRMDKMRQDILEARYRDEWRELRVTYIFGPTATGKTRGVMEQYGYSNVYRVTDYRHPFDRYAQEPVLCLDEFRSSLSIGEMLNYLEGYPLNLPARFAHRAACFTQVYIISNIDLKKQYLYVQREEPATWIAFLRRIHNVIEYRMGNPPFDHGSAMHYVFGDVPAWVKEAERAEQAEREFKK